MSTKRKITWYELKRFCNELGGDQLGKDVLIYQNQKNFSLIDFEVLEDDFINPSGEGLEPVSFYKDEPEILEQEPVILEKGHPILLIK